MKQRQMFTFAAGLVLAALAMGCETEPTTPVATASPTPLAPMTTGTPIISATPMNMAMTKVEDIVGNPNNFIGQTVTVNAELKRVLSPRAFTLDEDGLTTTQDLLVISPQTPGVNLEAIDNQWLNNKVVVTGVVRRMVVADIEREIGWDLQPQLEAEYRDRPVLIAQSIRRS